MIDIESEDYLDKVISKHESHPSVQAIKGNVSIENEFEFNTFDQDTQNRQSHRV